jgi:hypothetical protein
MWLAGKSEFTFSVWGRGEGEGGGGPLERVGSEYHIKLTTDSTEHRIHLQQNS